MSDLNFLTVQKVDMTKSLVEVDRLLSGDITPLQRQMLLNYQRHSRAENSGNWERIFDEGMLVDEPHYVLNFKNGKTEVKGKEALRNFYRNIGTPVIYQHEQQIHLADTSFTSFSTSVNFMTGRQVLATGESGINPINPDGFYARAKTSLTWWPFDKQGRLMGEFGGELGEISSIEIPQSLFVSPQEAHEKLTPLIKPLPNFKTELA